MIAQKQKSKKRSDASLKQQPDDIVLFLDRNLGKHVIAEALRNAGHQVEIHDDHLPSDAPDEDWIKLISSHNWVGMTKDKRIRYRTAEINSIRDNRARVIVIQAVNLTGPDIAEILVKFHGRIRLFVTRETAPFIAGIGRSGLINRYDI